MVITGDLIDNLDELTANDGEIGKNFMPLCRKGYIIVWGNHEYFRDLPRIRRAWNNSPANSVGTIAVIRLLAGEAAVIFAGC